MKINISPYLLAITQGKIIYLILSVIILHTNAYKYTYMSFNLKLNYRKLCWTIDSGLLFRIRVNLEFTLKMQNK